MSDVLPLPVTKASKKSNSEGIKIVGLKEETKRMNEENRGSPMLPHESSVKAPTKNSKGNF
jgi:hypothetical protein